MALARACLFGAFAGLAAAQSAECPCIDALTAPSTAALASYKQGDKLVFTASGSTSKYYFPLNYGSGGCAAYDDGLPPSCANASKPGWCTASWCYVDPNNCKGVSKINTRFFPIAENLYFSYATCAAAGGSANTVEAWSSQQLVAAQNVIQLIEDYGRTARFQLENIALNHNLSIRCDNSAIDMCPCAECTLSATWQSKMDFLQTGYLAGLSGLDSEKARAKCLAQGISTAYKTAAAKESDGNFQRVGYSYYGDQATGSYTSWPREDMCESKRQGWDPRARPWYAAGATGPKDIIIIADVSGSMSTAGRSELAKKAVMQILDTLTWKDFATVILFNHDVAQVFSEELRPLTDKNRNAMKTWCESQLWNGGGTNFGAPLTKAFEIIERSVSSGSTSMCQKAVMFLTDGEDTSFGSEDNFKTVKENCDKYDVFMFTYAIGADADTSKVKRLACENRGVFYPVPDNADLGDIMSAYYEYFAHGQEMCSASFVSYTSSTGGQTLFAGCMAAYDRTGPSPDLLGVTCMDVNQVTDVAAWKTTAGWPFFACTASDMTKQCRQVNLMECHRQKVRLAYSKESVCDMTADQRQYASVSASFVCPCTDPTCRDDPTFTDEKGYFCDTWVGDDCKAAAASWGYSDAGLKEVQEKCKRSCGLCDWSSGACPGNSSVECPMIPVAPECRACLGRTSGVDIEQNPMACPPGAPRNIAPTDLPPSDAAAPVLPQLGLLALMIATAAAA